MIVNEAEDFRHKKETILKREKCISWHRISQQIEYQYSSLSRYGQVYHCNCINTLNNLIFFFFFIHYELSIPIYISLNIPLSGQLGELFSLHIFLFSFSRHLNNASLNQACGFYKRRKENSFEKQFKPNMLLLGTKANIL